MAFNPKMFLRDGKFPEGFEDIYHNAGFPSDKVRSRGPFIMYLLSETDLTYDDIRALNNGESNLSEEERYKLFEDFTKELKDHPVHWRQEDSSYVMDEDASENCAIYGKWFKKAMNKMKDVTIPSADNINTPSDAYEFIKNFDELNMFVKDIVQEYAVLWKMPETSAVILDEMGEEEMGIFNRVENLTNSLGNFNMGILNTGDKAKAIYYPEVMDFINTVAGKKYSELDIEKLSLINYGYAVNSTMIPSLMADPEKNAEKYTRFIETGEADFDPKEIKFKSPISDKQVTLRENMEELSEQIDEFMGDVLSPSKKSYLEYLPAEMAYRLFHAVPEGTRFKTDAPEAEKKAVHDLFINTAGNLYTYYSNSTNHAEGKSFVDLIVINGQTLPSIIKEKYGDLNLTKEQERTAMEYEFTAALTDESKTISFVPYMFTKGDKKTIAPADPITVPHYEREITRTFNDSVDVLMDNSNNKKYGKNLFQILSNAEDSYNLLYDKSGITDSAEFKKMLGSFKELHELYESIQETGLVQNGRIGENVFERLASQYGYTKEMVSDLLKETAKNASDYITAKNASGRYRMSEKGNERLMCAAGFINDIDHELTVRTHPDIKLKDAEGEKTARERKPGEERRKISFKSLMEEGNKERKDTIKIENNAARNNKKRMMERTRG